MDWIFALATSAELVVTRPCALTSVINFASTQGKVTLSVGVFHVEAFTTSPLCYHLNYLTTSLIQVVSRPGVDSFTANLTPSER